MSQPDSVRVCQKVITKQTVVDALMFEPLRFGKFWHSDDSSVKPGCDVCAVGAVLRKASVESTIVRDNIVIDHMKIGNRACKHCVIGFDPIALLEEGNYLGALSCFFESLDPYYGLKQMASPEVRDRCIRFVTRHFPEQFTITIPISPITLEDTPVV